MKKSMLFLVCCALAATTFAQAQWGSKDKIKGNGQNTTETRTTASYDEIAIVGFFDVDLVAGTEGKITLEGESNLLPLIKIEVDGNTLKIYTDKNSSFHSSGRNSIRITVPFETLNKISLTGSGDVSSKNTIKTSRFVVQLSGSGDMDLDLDATETELSLSGSGDVVLKGNTDTLTTAVSGSGDINASNCKAKNVNLSISGSGDCTVFCTDNLKARVSGSGDIQYKGDPKTKDTKVSGSGTISKG